MSERDSLRSFLFEDFPVRGQVVHLDATWREALSRHQYPAPLRNLLGEMMTASVLLTGTLKLNGVMTMQIQGSGPVKLAVVECSSERLLRGMISWQGDVEQIPWSALFGKGIMAITLEQRDSGERYQGIVDLSGDSLTHALEHYLAQSEQLETRLWLTANEQTAAGLMLQRMPGAEAGEDADAWPRVTQLAQTIRTEELIDLDAQTIVHRLFHEETVRLFEVKPVAYRCACSRERVENALRLLGHEEMSALLTEHGKVSVDCEFCNRHYEFDPVDIEALFAEAVSTLPRETRH